MVTVNVTSNTAYILTFGKSNLDKVSLEAGQSQVSHLTLFHQEYVHN
jgi:hypothetical protein